MSAVRRLRLGVARVALTAGAIEDRLLWGCVSYLAFLQANAGARWRRSWSHFTRAGAPAVHHATSSARSHLTQPAVTRIGAGHKPAESHRRHVRADTETSAAASPTFNAMGVGTAVIGAHLCGVDAQLRTVTARAQKATSRHNHDRAATPEVPVARQPRTVCSQSRDSSSI